MNDTMRMKLQIFGLACMMLILMSCSLEPRPIKLGVDRCAHCKMTLTDPKFGGELVTAKGKIYVFDDLSCMATFYKMNSRHEENDRYYCIDYLGEMPFISVEQAHFLKSEQEFHTPMGSSTAAFGSLKKIEVYMKGKIPGEVLGWTDLIK